VLPALFGRADRRDLHATRDRLGEHTHVLVDLLRVRQLARRAGDVAEDRFRGRDAGAGRHVVDERERKKGSVVYSLIFFVYSSSIG
jgi:hypothetical protein